MTQENRGLGRDSRIEWRPIASLIPDARNARLHSEKQVTQLAGSLKAFGWMWPVLVDDSAVLIAGHGRILAAQKLQWAEAPVIVHSHLTPAERRAYVIADNRLAEQATWDAELLRVELGALSDVGFDLGSIGFELGEIESLAGTRGAAGTLSEKFLVAPFTVLNARDGWWQERKRQWMALGIRSEVGRGDNMLGLSAAAELKRGTSNLKGGLTFGTTMQPYGANDQGAASLSGTSIFDPVLCELVYRWFSPPGGMVFDPFAGGSVRGIVASKLGRDYVGIDLRAEQLDENRKQAAEICGEYAPRWIEGDSRNTPALAQGVHADLVFSCPPYADLERYSDDARDLSTLEYSAFLEGYREIIRHAASVLRPDRFACFVVGDVRDDAGYYRGFVPDTIRAFEDAGLRFYNEAILVTMVGSLPIRTGRSFSAARKLGKTHQNVLVFVKGDAKAATAACGKVEIDDTLFAETEGAS
jgi:DNA modification methylase